jgi:hypothetical protein
MAATVMSLSAAVTFSIWLRAPPTKLAWRRRGDLDFCRPREVQGGKADFHLSNMRLVIIARRR